MILTFHPHLAGMGLPLGETARLGELRVGWITPVPGARRRFSWSVNLCDWPKRCGAAECPTKARIAIGAETGEWLRAMGALAAKEHLQFRVEEE